MTPPPIAATILAAGQGSRLGGRPKTALLVDGASLLERLAAALRANGIASVSIVIGPYADTLLPLAARGAIHPLAHPERNSSLIDSQRLALAAHAQARPDHDLMLLVGDLPLAGQPCRAGPWYTIGMPGRLASISCSPSSKAYVATRSSSRRTVPQPPTACRPSWGYATGCSNSAAGWRLSQATNARM